MISREIIEAIRERVDIADVVGQVVTLKRKGTSLVGLCPFHKEKTPSFNVLPHKGIFHCFGCGEGGDVFAFVMKTRGIEFSEAVRELADSAGVHVEDRELTPDERRRIQARASLHDVCEATCLFFQDVLLTRPEGKAARDYLAGRGMSAEIIERYRLGFAPPSWDALLNHLHRKGIEPSKAVGAGVARLRERDQSAYDLFRGRIIVPIEDARGRVVAFGGRVLPGVDPPGRGTWQDAPKYVNSPETEIYHKSSVLYGLSRARAAAQRSGRLIVVEGYFDVLSLHQAGFEETVATCGTSLTPDHVRVIRPLTSHVIALFDSDEAGLRAAVRSMELFVDAGIEPRRLQLDGAKDPDEFVQEQGSEAFETLLARAEPLFELVLRRAIQRHGSTPGGKEAVIADLAPLLRAYSPTSRAGWIGRLARSLGVPEPAIADRVGRGRDTPPADVSRPARWRGNAELNHLLWLLLHFPAEVADVLTQVEDPLLVSDRPTVLQAISLLLQGTPLPEVLDRIRDEDLARVLRVAAAREDLYKAEQAAAAIQQILDRLRGNRIRAALVDLDREIAGCAPEDDGSRYFSLLERRQSLQKEHAALRDRKVR